MIKEWYIQVNKRKEGPYSIQQLRHDPRVTPDTLVWKKGFPQWIAIRYVAELNELFEDAQEFTPPEPTKPILKKIPLNDELAIDWRENNPQFVFWILIAILVIAYAFYQTYAR